MDLRGLAIWTGSEVDLHGLAPWTGSEVDLRRLASGQAKCSCCPGRTQGSRATWTSGVSLPNWCGRVPAFLFRIAVAVVHVPGEAKCSCCPGRTPGTRQHGPPVCLFRIAVAVVHLPGEAKCLCCPGRTHGTRATWTSGVSLPNWRGSVPALLFRIAAAVRQISLSEQLSL